MKQNGDPHFLFSIQLSGDTKTKVLSDLIYDEIHLKILKKITMPAPPHDKHVIRVECSKSARP
jgi:hypothetical protein